MDSRLQMTLDILEKRGRHWTTATQISHAATERGSKLDQRIIAELASESDGQILGTGDGYILYTHASDQEILDAYRYNIKRAIGSDIRARSIISNARRHGRLTDERKVMDVKHEVECALAKSKASSISQPQPVATATHINSVSQTELNL